MEENEEDGQDQIEYLDAGMFHLHTIVGFIALVYNSPLLSNLSTRPGFSLVNLGSLSSKENEFKISISIR